MWISQFLQIKSTDLWEFRSWPKKQILAEQEAGNESSTEEKGEAPLFTGILSKQSAFVKISAYLHLEIA